MQIARPVLDVQPRAIAGWSLERPVIGNGHAGCGRGALEKGRCGTSPASYLIGLDVEFGPFFLKFSSYFPYGAKLYLLTELGRGSARLRRYGRLA
jgi:hypothetical protein